MPPCGHLIRKHGKLRVFLLQRFLFPPLPLPHLSRLIPQELTATTRLGRSRDGLYEPALADSEREAVADLLQYLENVGSLHPDDRDMLTIAPERRNGFFYWRALTITEHACIFRECRPAKKCQFDLCRNHRTRYKSQCGQSRMMLINWQMFEKSSQAPYNQYSFSFRALISRYNEQQVLH